MGYMIRNGITYGSDKAIDIKYDNTESGMAAEDVQAAIDEVNDKADTIGDLTDLETTEKNSVVGAVNEVNGNIGDLTTLETTEKGSAVEAINELNTNFTRKKAWS